jgi:hypothetical protein
MSNEIKPTGTCVITPELAAIEITVTNTNEYESRKFQLFGSNKYLFSDKFSKDGSLLSVDGVHIKSYIGSISYRDILSWLLTHKICIKFTSLDSRNGVYPNLEEELKNSVRVNTVNYIFGTVNSSLIDFKVNPVKINQYSIVSNRHYLINEFTTLDFPALAPKEELKIFFYASY